MHQVICTLILVLLPSAMAVAAARTSPFRAGIIKFNRELDRIKPLAMADEPGWVFHKGRLIGADHDGRIIAMDYKTRSTSWSYFGQSSLVMPISVFGEAVFLGFRDGSLINVDSQSGEKKWQASLDTFSMRPITVSGKHVLVLSSGQQLYALDVSSGSVLWLYDAGFPDGLTIRGSAAPVADGETVYIGLTSGEIRAINITSGKLLWTVNPDQQTARFHDVVGIMAVVNKRLLVSRYDGFVGGIDLDSSDHRNVWKDTLPAVTTSLVHEGIYYVGCLNGEVVAYDAATGNRQWRAETGTPVASMVAMQKKLYVAGSNGRVTLLEQAGGKTVWHDDIGGEVVSSPVVVGDIVYISTGLKVLYGHVVGNWRNQKTDKPGVRFRNVTAIPPAPSP